MEGIRTQLTCLHSFPTHRRAAARRGRQRQFKARLKTLLINNAPKSDDPPSPAHADSCAHNHPSNTFRPRRNGRIHSETNKSTRKSRSGTEQTLHQQQPERSRLAGTSETRTATSNTDKVQYLLTALHQNDAPTWPSPQARQALYSDVPAERVQGMYATLHGRLPSWLHGSLYRNGPGKFSGAAAVFDGCAMVARFAVNGRDSTSHAGQSVVVSHRFIETTYLQAYRAAGGDIRWTLGHPSGVKRGPLSRMQYLTSLSAGALTHGVHLGDNALISIFPSGDKLVAHTETLSGTYEIDPETLETLGRIEHKKSAGVTGMVKTAHPAVLANGDVINLAADFMPVRSNDSRIWRPPHITVIRHPNGDATVRERLASLPYLRASAPSWVHQAAVSSRYAIVVQNPCLYDIEKMVFGESGDYLVFKWQPELGTLIHIVPLDPNSGEKIREYRAPAFLGTHWINAFEEDQVGPDGPRRLLHVDGCVTDDPRLMAHWALDVVRSGTTGGKQIEISTMRRLTLDLNAPNATLELVRIFSSILQQLYYDGCMVVYKRFMYTHFTCSSAISCWLRVVEPLEHVLTSFCGTFLDSAPDGGPLLRPLVPDEAHGHAFELPGINPEYMGRQHRYVYAACAKRPTNCWNALCKADIESGEVKVWHEPGAACWEPIFVARPRESGDEEVDEDDGVVLSTIMQADGRSALLVLDATSWKEIARAVLPYGLPNGFHGAWVGAKHVRST